jgi:ribosomal protein S12 methylthiotransferase accessory factor
LPERRPAPFLEVEPLTLDSPDALRLLVSSRYGLIRRIRFLEKEPGESPLPVLCQAILGAFPIVRRVKAGVGKGITQQAALVCGIAEALERYCSICPSDFQIKRFAFNDVKSVAVHPREFILYSDRQYRRSDFPYIPFDPSGPIEWILAKELLTDRYVYVPAALVYLRYGHAWSADQFVQGTSNGLAAGENLDTALLAGTLELIERDAFLRTWNGCKSVAKLDTTELGHADLAIIKHYASKSVEIGVYVLPAFSPAYTVMAVSKDKAGGLPKTAVGLGCSINPMKAIRKAIFELCQVRHGELWRIKNTDIRIRLNSLTDIRGATDHSGFYSCIDEPEAFRFLETAKTVSIHSLPYNADLAEGEFFQLCLTYLRNLGIRLFYVDVTTPDLWPFKVRVARVLATTLQPIYFGYGLERLCTDTMMLNSFPHPLG